jgi:hypothetical protein
MQSPSAGRKHAADQNTERDVIEDMNENVHWRRPRHAQNSRLSGCQCDGAPWLIAASRRLGPYYEMGRGAVRLLVWYSNSLIEIKKWLRRNAPLPLSGRPACSHSDHSLLTKSRTVQAKSRRSPVGLATLLSSGNGLDRCGGLQRIV